MINTLSNTNLQTLKMKQVPIPLEPEDECYAELEYCKANNII
jgi:hypothetical protein